MLTARRLGGAGKRPAARHVGPVFANAIQWGLFMNPALDRERFADLIDAVAARQDRTAFAELFTFFAPRVKSYLLRLGAGEALAEEIAQDVMVAVWRKAALFDRQKASASTWIFTIARNRRIDAARRSKLEAFDPNEPMLAPAATDAPDKNISIVEREAHVRAALDQLPHEQRALLEAAFYEGLSHRDIAMRDGLPLGTVKSRIRLAFARLRGQLDGEGLI